MKTHLNLDPVLSWRLGQSSWASLCAGDPLSCLSLRPTHPISSTSPGTNHSSPTQVWDQGVLVGKRNTRGTTKGPEARASPHRLSCRESGWQTADSGMYLMVWPPAEQRPPRRGFVTCRKGPITGRARRYLLHSPTSITTVALWHEGRRGELRGNRPMARLEKPLPTLPPAPNRKRGEAVPTAFLLPRSSSSKQADPGP